MKSVTIPGETHVLGEAQGYTPLSVRRHKINVLIGDKESEQPVVSSEWEFSMEDFHAILEGGRLRLTILGHEQPPVLLEIVRRG